MSAAAAAILDGMPDARDLHRLDSGGQTVIFAGSRQMFRYPEDDTAMRNIAVAALRQLGYGGRRGGGGGPAITGDTAPPGRSGGGRAARAPGTPPAAGPPRG